MKILLTGGLGYIGTSLINRLSKHELIVCSKSKKRDLQNYNNVIFEFVDITSDDFLQIVKKHKPDLVIHLASITGLKNFIGLGNSKQEAQQNAAKKILKELE